MSGQTLSHICVVYWVMKSTIFHPFFHLKNDNVDNKWLPMKCKPHCSFVISLRVAIFYFNWLYFLLKCLLCNNWLNLFRLSLCLSSLHDDILWHFCMYSSRLYVQLLAKIPWFLKLQVNPKSVQFFQHEIDVLLVTSLVWDDNFFSRNTERKPVWRW